MAPFVKLTWWHVRCNINKGGHRTSLFLLTTKMEVETRAILYMMQSVYTLSHTHTNHAQKCSQDQCSHGYISEQVCVPPPPPLNRAMSCFLRLSFCICQLRKEVGCWHQIFGRPFTPCIYISFSHSNSIVWKTWLMVAMGSIPKVFVGFHILCIKLFYLRER